jgi:HSP20 family protein
MGILDVVPFRQRRTNVPGPTDRDRDPILALRADVDRAFGNFWNLMSLPMPPAAFSAFADDEEHDFKVDVRDNGKEVEVVAELPGFTEDDIEVTVGADSITIRAERQEERQERSANAVVLERSVGVLERTIPLPEGSLPDEAAARFKNGALRIVVPKSAESQSRRRRIKIQAS